MLREYRTLCFALLCIGLAGCITDATYNRAVSDLDAKWKAVNSEILNELGQRTIDSTKYASFLAVQGAARRLGMVIEQQDYATGFLFVTSAAPTPLTKEEWAEVQRVETPGMRETLVESIGTLAKNATLEAAGKDLLVNVLVTEHADGVNVAVSVRQRNNLAQGDRIRRMEPPPTALRIGLEKFWAAFDDELGNLSGQDDAGVEIDDQPSTPIAAASSARSQLPSSRRFNSDGIAVLIGNSLYPHPVPSVDYAYNDAAAMKDFVVEVLGFEEDNIIDLRDVTRSQMSAVFGNERSGRGQLWRWVRPRESDVVVFYSGHGVSDTVTGRQYLMPIDADPNSPDINGYALELLYENLRQLDAATIAVYLDACFSGDSAGGRLIRESGIAVVPRQTETGLTVLAAAQSDQVASWDEENQQGLFTGYLLRGLYGAADTNRYGRRDGDVTLSEIKAYLDREMTYAARRRYGRQQAASIRGDLDQVLVTDLDPAN
jgi:hypothetical protein